MRQNIKQEVREYVKRHNSCVTSKEVINYILHERNIDTTEKYIRRILPEALRETGGVLKPYGISEEIRDYIKIHNGCVSSKEVINYILHEKNIDTTENSVHAILSIVLKETGGVLKPYGISEEIRDYVKRHNNCVSSKEVINYILHERNIDTTENCIGKILLRVLKETGGVLKPYGILEKIQDHIKTHNNCVTSEEVKTI